MNNQLMTEQIVTEQIGLYIRPMWQIGELLSETLVNGEEIVEFIENGQKKTTVTKFENTPYFAQLLSHFELNAVLSHSEFESEKIVKIKEFSQRNLDKTVLVTLKMHIVEKNDTNLKEFDVSLKLECPKNQLFSSSFCIPELTCTLYKLALNGHLKEEENMALLNEILFSNRVIV